MKILFCTNAFQNVTNGPAKFANLILEINQLYPQHEVRILTEDVTEERLSDLRYVYKVHLQIPLFLKPLGQILRMFQYYRRVKQIEQAFSFDILVYNNAFTGLYAAIVSEKPTVGMINDDNNLRGHLSNFRFSRVWLKRFTFRQLESLSARKHRSIITNSDYLTQQVQQSYHIASGKMFRLYKAIDIGKIAYSPNRAFKEPIKILFVKADYVRGGLAILAGALQQLSEFTFLLTVIGPLERFKSSIEQSFQGVANVTLDFRGEQPQQVVRELMGAYDIFCVPALQEALGVANMEALASGIAVVSTSAGGIPEVLDYGNNGWLVKPGNAGVLASAIKNCIEKKEERQGKTEKGRKFVERFNKEVMLENLIYILQQCLSHR